MSIVPKDWTPTASAIFYNDARAAIDWLAKAFGFEARLVVDGPNGVVAHSELVLDGALIMVAQAGAMPGSTSPKEVGGGYTQSLYVFVADVDTHCEHARASGAQIIQEPSTQHYGDRTYGCLDCEGHAWTFGQRVDDAAYQAATQDLPS